MRILLINPSTESIYPGPPAYRNFVPLNLLALAGPLLAAGHEVKIFDINNDDFLIYYIPFVPEIIGITATTPLIGEAENLAKALRALLPKTKIILGGAHAGVVPQEIFQRRLFDLVLAGEADLVLPWKIANGLSDEGFQWWQAEPVLNLDALPLPAYELIEAGNYHQSRFFCRRSPVARLEFSRGCYGKCTFCSHIIQQKMRFKSVDRAIEEMKMVRDLGYQEVQIDDPCFGGSIQWVKEFCERMISENIKMLWWPHSGTRADRADLEMFRLMKRAGCYRVIFGVESGSQRILDSIKKEITLDEVRRAVSLARAAGLETEAFFIFGLPGETETDLQATIDFAVELDVDYCKPPQVLCPYPGTPIGDAMQTNGQIKSRDWSKYHYFADMSEVYDHDTLDWPTIRYYQKLFNRRFYSRPNYRVKQLLRALRTGKWLAAIQDRRMI